MYSFIIQKHVLYENYLFADYKINNKDSISSDCKLQMLHGKI